VPLNRRILFARVPHGLPVPGDFGHDTVEVPAPGPGQFLSRTLWLSLDPYLRNVMKGHALYGVALRPGDPMHGETVSQVVESCHPDFAPGELVVVKNGWQEYGLSDGQGVRKVDPAVAPVATALGVLGMPGLTGYAGLVYLGEPRPGQHGGAGRSARGSPCVRHRGLGREVSLCRRRTGLRGLHQPSFGEPSRGDRAGVSRRRGCLFRQPRWRRARGRHRHTGHSWARW